MKGVMFTKGKKSIPLAKKLALGSCAGSEFQGTHMHTPYVNIKVIGFVKDPLLPHVNIFH